MGVPEAAGLSLGPQPVTVTAAASTRPANASRRLFMLFLPVAAAAPEWAVVPAHTVAKPGDIRPARPWSDPVRALW
ncbi:hypothetical protein KRMM14A1004_08250 [Krasilnikovia sp. MM14-A1004]